MNTTRVGFLSVESHPREARLARVRINGTDVSRNCFAAHDEEGWADCFVRDAHGLPILTPDRRAVQTERLHGDVVIDFPKGLD